MSSTTTSAANIIGAMFAIRNALMIVPSEPALQHDRKDCRPPQSCAAAPFGPRLRPARSWLLLPADANALDFLGDREVAARAQDFLGKQFLGRLFDVFFARV